MKNVISLLHVKCFSNDELDNALNSFNKIGRKESFSLTGTQFFSWIPCLSADFVAKRNQSSKLSFFHTKIENFTKFKHCQDHMDLIMEQQCDMMS